MTKIALVAPPMYSIPPRGYAGTERVLAALGQELHRRGHEVTLIGPGDSDVPYRLIPTVDRALWGAGYQGDVVPFLERSAAIAGEHLDEFDIVHSHLEGYGLRLDGRSATPVLTTLHGRLDAADTSRLLAAHPRAPLVAISENQRRWFRQNRWIDVVHHGLAFRDLPSQPGPGLAVVGRATYEKGIAEAIDVARQTGRPLTIAAKAYHPDEIDFVRRIIEPAVRDGVADFRGEISEEERDRLMASSTATLMLGGWPEPFGLVAIESLAQGTPVIARRAGALPELIEHGVDGFLVDDLPEAVFALARIGSLDRTRIRERARLRFSVARMTDRYESAYASTLLQSWREIHGDLPATAAPSAVDRRRAGLPAGGVAGVATATTLRRHTSGRLGRHGRGAIEEEGERAPSA